MSKEEIPDRLSSEQGSPYYKPSIGKRIDVYFKDIRQTGTCVEYCISEGWILRSKMSMGKPAMERGKFVTTKHFGPVRVVWREEG